MKNYLHRTLTALFVASLLLSTSCSEEDETEVVVPPTEETSGIFIDLTTLPTGESLDKTLYMPCPPTHKRWVYNDVLSDEFDDTPLDALVWEYPSTSVTAQTLTNFSTIFDAANSNVLNGSLELSASLSGTTISSGAITSVQPLEYGFYECRISASGTDYIDTKFLFTYNNGTPIDITEKAGFESSEFTAQTIACHWDNSSITFYKDKDNTTSTTEVLSTSDESKMNLSFSFEPVDGCDATTLDNVMLNRSFISYMRAYTLIDTIDASEDDKFIVHDATLDKVDLSLSDNNDFEDEIFKVSIQYATSETRKLTLGLYNSKGEQMELETMTLYPSYANIELFIWNSIEFVEGETYYCAAFLGEEDTVDLTAEYIAGDSFEFTR